MGDIIISNYLCNTKGKENKMFVPVRACVCVSTSINKHVHIHVYVHMFICDLVFAYLHVCRCTHVWFLIHYVVLISSTLVCVPMKEKKTKMSHNNLIPVMQVKYTLAHLHGEMKYEVWRVSPI